MHAYLIIAHSEFDVLQALICALDDKRNDIYVHIDKKVKRIPELHSSVSRLYIVEKRIKVTWGDVSQIRAEYALLEMAKRNGPYSHYHIISGVHFPLKSQDYIHRYFEAKEDKSVLIPMMISKGEVEMKVGKYHFFLSHLISKKPLVNKVYHLLWRLSLLPQRRMVRDVSFIHGKASNWCSLCENAVNDVLDAKENTLKRFRRTFCADEFFILSIVQENIVYDNNLLYVDFVNTTPRIIANKELRDLSESSPFIFARKINMTSLSRID